jgi:DNA-binding NtrC family response regulator
LPFGHSARSASILVVDDEPDVADFFRQSFAGRRARELMSCISPPQRRKRWIASGRKSNRRSSLYCLTSTCRAWTGCNCREIKQRRPNLPVMMVTAYGDDERRRRARELGASEFITKPVDFDQLKEQLRQLPAAAG